MPVASPLQNVDPHHPAPAPLDQEAGFDLLLSMYGTFHDLYERCGGVESVLREIDGEDAEAILE
jgi:hypothetical protein